MRIKKIQINGFGNIIDKEITFEDGVNIIYGKNESGKSTILKFITSMLYGINRTKNGKEISDYEKYKPWSNNEFSGKILYELDNNEKIEIYREFNKKSSKVYDISGQDITNKYGIDKSKGTTCFYEQTNLSEEIFLKTAICEQTEIKLKKEEQLTLLQRISNVLSTGNDNTSVKLALNKLKDKQIEEIGTDRTIGRPINIVNEKLINYTKELNKIELEKNEIEKYKFEKQNIKNELNLLTQKIKCLKEYKIIKEEEIIEEEKIKINKKNIFELEDNINNLEEKEKELKISPKIKKDNKYIIIGVIICIISVIIGIILNNFIFSIFLIIIAIIFGGLQIKENNKFNKLQNKFNEKLLNLKKEKEILKNNLNKNKNELQILEKENKIKIEEKINLLKNKYLDKLNINEINKILNQTIESITIEIIQEEERENSLEIRLKTNDIKYKNILENFEKIPELKEKINNLELEKNNLISLNNSINLVKIAIEEAYEKMKENITPNFINKLKEIVSVISDKKYSNVKFNDIDGLTVELKNGEYIKADRLSVGTLEQMYFALRLATLDEITNENIPIILDESFVYYDSDRLENIIEYFNNNYKDKQIIIFSCNEREKSIINNKDITYNFIEILA